HFGQGSASTACSICKSNGWSWMCAQVGHTRIRRARLNSKFVMMSSTIGRIGPPILGMLVVGVHVPVVKGLVAGPETDLVMPCRILGMGPPGEVEEVR